MKNKNLIQIILVCVCVCSALLLSAEEEKPVFDLKKVSGDVYCLSGGGGNIGILKLNNGLLLVDAQMKETAEDALKLIATISTQPVRYLINTHYHDDHTGADDILGKDAEFIMHPNCKKTLVENQKKGEENHFLGKVKPWTEGMTQTFDNETIHLLHFGPGHTAGDLVVVFEKAKVVHAGDLFFNGMPPYIDVNDGSDTGNWIKTIQTLCKKYPDYKFIPGHGNVATAAEYLKFADYLGYLGKEVEAAIKAGKTKEQAMESIDTTQFDEIRKNELNEFMTIKNNIAWIYDEMTRKK
jgi:cyclase